MGVGQMIPPNPPPIKATNAFDGLSHYRTSGSQSAPRDSNLREMHRHRPSDSQSLYKLSHVCTARMHPLVYCESGSDAWDADMTPASWAATQRPWRVYRGYAAEQSHRLMARSYSCMTAGDPPQSAEVWCDAWNSSNSLATRAH